MDRVMIVKQDALLFCEQTELNFDLIFIDPPFDYPELQILINAIFKKSILRKDGILIIEHEKTNPIGNSSFDYSIIKQKKIGRSIISFIINRN